MRKLPASEQPTQLVVREVTADPVVAPPIRRQSSPFSWVFALMLVLGLCGIAGFLAAIGARGAYLSLGEDENIIYEVVARPEPLTVASTRGEVAGALPLSSLFTPEVQYWAPLIAEWAKAWEIDPNLIATVIQIESCGDPFVSSGAGAQGLFQVMPFHFDPGEDMLNVENNARRGLAYLNGGLDASEGHAGLALAGYNGGHSVITKGYAAWHSETRRYYYWGAGIYFDATTGRTDSPRLQEWLTAGGQGLCDRAAQSQINYNLQTGGG
jgi:hypothetical protein